MQASLDNKYKNKDCFIITTHFGEQESDYKLSIDKNKWNQKIYQDLYVSICESFDCTPPIRLFENIDGNKFYIDGIDDILNAFDDNENNKSLHFCVEIASSKQKKNTTNQTRSQYQMWFDTVLKLPQYYQTFIDAGYMDLDYIDGNIDEQELIYDLNISNKSHRQKILNAIQDLMRRETPKDNIQLTEKEFEDDQEFDFDENNSWDDLELTLPNEQIIQSSVVSESPNDEFQECWQCCECDTINNVRLTIRQYHYKCCGCGEVCYLPNQTPTIYKSEWDTPTDYLLKQNKIWICSSCGSQNTNMTTNKCQLCAEEKCDGDDIKCEHCNRCISSLSFMIHQIHCIKTKSKVIFWVCPKCNGKETKNECKCTVCGCNRPTTHNYLTIKLNGDLVFGFCRYHFAHFIPVVIKYLIIDFIDIQTFSSKTKHLQDCKNVSCYYNIGFRTELFGDKYFKSPDFNVWKYRLTMDSKYVVKMAGDNEAAKIYDIAIGITFRGSSFDKKTGKVTTIDKYYTIKGHGRTSLSNFSHPMFRDGDVVIAELDCNKRTLSYGINENWYGVAYSNLPHNTKYRLYVDVKQRGVTIQLIN